MIKLCMAWDEAEGGLPPNAPFSLSFLLFRWDVLTVDIPNEFPEMCVGRLS